MRSRALVAVLVMLGLGSTAGSVAATAGPWGWPLAGPHLVARPFEPPPTPYAAGHRGVDLTGTLDQPVLAAGAGRVSYAGLLAGRGVVVVVHGELRTTYEPVTAVVHVGQLVTLGQRLGSLVAGQHCPAACLHWGLLRGADYLDPVQLVRRGPSRLLPVPTTEVAAGPGPGPDFGPADGVGRGADAPAQPLEPVDQPAFSLRATEAPWGAVAVLTLLGGLLLLLRPARRPPDGPAAPALGVVRSPPAEPADLVTERARRRG